MTSRGVLIVVAMLAGFPAAHARSLDQQTHHNRNHAPTAVGTYTVEARATFQSPGF